MAASVGASNLKVARVVNVETLLLTMLKSAEQMPSTFLKSSVKLVDSADWQLPLVSHPCQARLHLHTI